jgi:hypothetical protein
VGDVTAALRGHSQWKEERKNKTLKTAMSIPHTPHSPPRWEAFDESSSNDDVESSGGGCSADYTDVTCDGGTVMISTNCDDATCSSCGPTTDHTAFTGGQYTCDETYYYINGVMEGYLPGCFCDDSDGGSYSYSYGGELICPGYDASEYCDCGGDCISHQDDWCSCEAAVSCCWMSAPYGSYSYGIVLLDLGDGGDDNSTARRLEVAAEVVNFGLLRDHGDDVGHGDSNDIDNHGDDHGNHIDDRGALSKGAASARGLSFGDHGDNGGDRRRLEQMNTSTDDEAAMHGLSVVYVDPLSCCFF